MSELILGFGEALVDVLPSGEVVGGAPLNFSVRAAQLGQAMGFTTVLISRIGSDERGEKILQHLQSTPLDTSAIQVDATHPSGYVDVTLEDGHPSYVIGEQVAWDHIAFDDSVAQIARRSSALCFGTLAQRCEPTRQTLARCLQTAERAIKIFDINLRLPHPSIELIQESLRHADVLKCNEEELLLLCDWLQLDIADRASDQSTAIATATRLQQRFELQSVFWTRGASGCMLQRGEQVTSGDVPQLPRAPQADSVGAGDAASAALAVGLVAGWSDARIVALANYCGAFAASQRGATTPFPDDFLDKLVAD